MSYVIGMWIVWGGLAVILLGLLMYRGSLTRYEEDQLFLDDSNEMEHREQNEILRKVKKIEPVIRIFGGITGLVTVVIVSFYLYDAIQHF
ncbi:MAG TPA: hypothetical protein VHX63_15425 [Acidobacteriaceae bacterium]|jgi:hypothetical protein|nr:hypothetical protein [Acidobacteriaceae bacterium]